MVSVPTPQHKQLFFELLDLNEEQRESRLASIATDDPPLADRLRELLGAHSRAESALGGLDPAIPPEVDALRAGDHVGPYRLERELGEGGFGRVWLAEQTEPVQRPVALKLLKAGMDTREVVGRFQAERQALARMEHPGIAKVYDAGETERGRPWFAMEYVDGLPLTDYCDTRRLDLQARLELFAAVCRAVQHAHTKGVVHRDLKPNNVLVTEVDGVPQPKVIDFGIAKAVEEPLVDDTPRTRGGQWMGTPAFMAPEQLDAAADVDTRADIYSLGALLYVLLAGAPPFQSTDDSKLAWHERIREELPSRPSTRVGQGSSPERPGITRRTLQRELDWVVMRCLEKEPDRRYDSAAVLGNELERVLMGEPVLAGPPGLTYRMSRFVRRNRVTLAVTAAVFLLLFFGLIFALDREQRARDAELEARLSAESARQSEQQAREAESTAREAEATAREAEAHARDSEARALEELTRSRAVAKLTEHMLLSVKPSVARGADTDLMVEMLERAEQYILDAGDHAPATEADLARMVGGAWWELGDYQRALPHFERALDLRRQSLGNGSPETLDSAHMLGTHYLTLGDLVRSEPLLRECFETYGVDSLETSEPARLAAASYAELLFRQGRPEEALEIRVELVRATTVALGPKHADTLRNRNNLARSMEAAGQLDEASDEFRAVLALQLADPTMGPEHPHTLMTRGNLSGLLRELGQLEEARDMADEVLAVKRRVLPPGHLSLLTSLNNVGELERRLGNDERAEELYREALELAVEGLGPASEPARILSLNLARVCIDLDRWGEALELLEPAARDARAAAGPTKLTLYIEQALADTLVHEERFADAAPLTEQTLVDTRELLGPDSIETAVISVLRGEVLAGLDDWNAAEPLLIGGCEALEGTGSWTPWGVRAAQALAGHFEAEDDAQRAELWRTRATIDPSDED